MVAVLVSGKARSALTAALVCVVCAAQAQDAAEQRRFLMGFTPFPYDMTLEAVAGVEEFLRANGDIIAIHFEGVPWAEARSGEAFHPKIIEEWERQLRARPPGGKVYVAVSPLDLARAGLATYRAQEEGLPLPEPFAGKAFDDDAVVSAYLSYCRRAIESLKPDYLAIGVEVNELYHNGFGHWDAYTRLHRQVYEALKQDHPDLPIFVTFTLHNMRNAGWADRAEMLSAFRELMPYNDVVAISFYPFMAQLSGDVVDCLEWVVETFGEFGKPYAITECGEPAETLVLEEAGITIPSGEADQSRVVSEVLAFANAHDFEFLIWYLSRDYDALWERIRAGAPEFFKAWKDCGLLAGDGESRPAREVWDEYFSTPYRRAGEAP